MGKDLREGDPAVLDSKRGEERLPRILTFKKLKLTSSMGDGKKRVGSEPRSWCWLNNRDRGDTEERPGGRAMDWVRIWGGRKIPRIKFRFWYKCLEE